MVKLDATRIAVNTAGSRRSTFVPAGGHREAWPFSVKYIANRAPKNMSSEARNKTMPTASSGGGFADVPRGPTRSAAMLTRGDATASAWSRGAGNRLLPDRDPKGGGG